MVGNAQAMLIWCNGISWFLIAASHHEACNMALLHSDFRHLCRSLTAERVHRRPCMVTTDADRQYLVDVKVHYLYKAPGVMGRMICAPRWNNTKTAECVSAPLLADDSVEWTWGAWSSTSSSTTTRRLILTGDKTSVQCSYEESVKGCHLASSCKQLAEWELGALRDGHYVLAAPRCTPVHIYCANMATNPREYISLTEENFSQYNNSMLGNWRTDFTKIRVKLSAMKIVVVDYSFATATPGFDPVQYMSAMGCYFRTPGTFKFKGDLTGTGFLFSSLVKIKSTGYKWSADIDYSPSMIRGSCSGHCGLCSMDQQVDHHLEVDVDAPSLT